MLLPALPVDLTETGLDVEVVRARAARGEPPASAEEYLWRVRLESEALPEIAEAEGLDPTVWEGRQTAYMPAQPDLPPTPVGLEPEAQWAAGVLQDFLDLRLGLSALEEEHNVGRERKVKVPPLKEEGKWRRFFFGSSSSRKREEEEEAVEAQEAGGGAGSKRPRLSAPVQLEEAAAAAVTAEEEEEEAEAEAMASPPPPPPPPPAVPMLPASAPASSLSLPLSAGLGVCVGGLGMTEAFAGPHRPTASLVLQFDQVCTVRLLGYHVQWLEGSPHGLAHEQGAWLFALLARLSQPLHPEAAALVRQLYRRCYILRASLPSPLDAAAVVQGENGGNDSSSSPPLDAAAVMQQEGEEQDRQRQKQHLARLNTLIAITGTYFSQGEEETAALSAVAGTARFVGAGVVGGEEGEREVVVDEGQGQGQEEEEGEIVESG